MSYSMRPNMQTRHLFKNITYRDYTHNRVQLHMQELSIPMCKRWHELHVSQTLGCLYIRVYTIMKVDVKPLLHHMNQHTYVLH